MLKTYNLFYARVIFIVAVLFTSIGCGGSSNTNYTPNNPPQETVTEFNELYENDADGDYIPNDVEALLGTNSHDRDENHNGVDDGLDTEGTHGDTFFDKLWYIHSLGTYTNDSNVLTILENDLNLLEVYRSYMGYNNGKNIIVQVVDTGVDTEHEDLKENIDMTRSFNGGVVGNPYGNHPHGTMVAGIMAAQAFNSKGVRGVIPFAKIAGSNWLESSQSIDDLETVWLSGDGANEIAVSNNSWGTYFSTDTAYEDIMEIGTSTLRDKKGRIYVFAAGNDRKINGNTNLQYIINNRFVIATAALKHDNSCAEYSSFGANIMISGYGGNYYDDSPTIGTTTIMGTSSNSGSKYSKTTWAKDINENYTYVMNGTSAASPMVAGSIALVLEACPNLTWRDVKYLLAKHAKQVDKNSKSWVTNSSGLKHSTDYGFGLVNTQGMIEECNSTYVNLPVEKSTVVKEIFNLVIDDNNTKQTFNVQIDESLNIEWVEVTLDSNHTNASDYNVVLNSPQNTTKILITQGSKVSGAWMDGGFRFSTPAMMGEDSHGIWSVDITDSKLGIEGSIKTIEVKIYGH